MHIYLSLSLYIYHLFYLSHTIPAGEHHHEGKVLLLVAMVLHLLVEKLELHNMQMIYLLSNTISIKKQNCVA